jgi:ABC-2 type transport system permease protein
MSRLFRGRFWALVLKELRQIRRDRRLVISLILPPAMQVLLFGFALDAEVRNMRLGVVDDSRTAESRELISVLTENRTFRLAGVYPTTAVLAQALGSGQLDVGVVLPYDFAKLRARGRPVTVQILLNGVNANTAQIAQGHVEVAPRLARQPDRQEPVSRATVGDPRRRGPRGPIRSPTPTWPRAPARGRGHPASSSGRRFSTIPAS